MGARKRLRIVPRVVFGATFVGVVPVCVAAVACGGSTTTGTRGDAASDANNDVQFLGVGAACFDACPQGVAVDAFAGGDAAGDGAADTGASDVFLGVAACCLDAWNEG